MKIKIDTGRRMAEQTGGKLDAGAGVLFLEFRMPFFNNWTEEN